MSWGSAAEFFAMGGYAFYVWGSFAAAILCMTVEPLSLRTRRKRALERVRIERLRNETAA